METLTLGKLQEIKRGLNPSDTNSLNDVLAILEKDIALRRKMRGVDCLYELHRDDDLLPENFRTPKSGQGDIVGMVAERMKAIIIDEYGRLDTIAGTKFINGKITYKGYIQKTEQYAIDGGNAWPPNFS